MSLHDTARSYGTVSRVLHWTMTVLFAWQFGGMLLKDVLEKGPVKGFWLGTHSSVGALLLILLMVRAIWELSEMRHRPPYGTGFIGFAAKAGHLVLYGLMLVIPTLALLRMFGSGKGARLFGIQFQAPDGKEIAWMTAPGNLLHGSLAWLLLALIIGHVVMVVVHRYAWGENLLTRMAGKAAHVA
ncbi:MAG: cytochrome b/b6 domain-containing protein [Novosphingobium sp.]|nr:cytochrome b/b6 domain-containing protein [Novosphingobium sp.]